MKPEEQRIAIAEACGWILLPDRPSGLHNPVGIDPSDGLTDHIPDYLNSLDAMHEAEEVLNGLNYHEYMRQVEKSVDPLRQCHESQAVFRFLRSTAAQRAEAFLQTFGIWTDS